MLRIANASRDSTVIPLNDLTAKQESLLVDVNVVSAFKISYTYLMRERERERGERERERERDRERERERERTVLQVFTCYFA